MSDYTLVAGVLPDSFEDKDLSEYTGQTGSFGFTTNISYDGSVSVEATSQGVVIYYATDVADASSSKTVSIYQYSGTGDHRGGSVLLNSNGDGYGAYLQPTSLDLNKYTGGSYDSKLSSTSVSPADNTWHKISLTHDGGDGYTASVKPSGGSQLGSVSVTDTSYSNLTRIGLHGYDTAVPYDMLGIV